MKFRLSTALLLIAIVAISLGWWVDHFNRNRRDIVGTWHYPTPEYMVHGYETILEVRPDGTFTKTEWYRFGCVIHDGNYSTDDIGQVTFSVKKVTDEIQEDEPRVTKVDEKFTFRCGIDKTGYLVLHRNMRGVYSRDEIKITWDAFMSRDAR